MQEKTVLSALRSFSMVRLHDCLGQPGGCLQWLGNPEITARSVLEWSNGYFQQIEIVCHRLKG